MILTPAAPNAGPTGGDGFAAPPRTCNLTTLLILLPFLTLIMTIHKLEAKNIPI